MPDTRIEEVDYNAFPGIAGNMRNDAIQLNKEVKELYKTLAEMKKNWYGPRYDELVTSFNKMIPDLNEILKLTVTKVPFTLETIANNYAKVDLGKGITAAVEKASDAIADVAKSAKRTFRFKETAVRSNQSSMDKNLKKVLELMDSIESKYKKLNWKSEASDEFQRKFTALKKNISLSITDVSKQFTKLMNDAIQDVSKAEKANTIK